MEAPQNPPSNTNKILIGVGIGAAALALICACLICLAPVILTLLGPAIGGVFSDVVNQLGTPVP